MEELVAVPDGMHNFLWVPNGEHFERLLLGKVVVVVIQSAFRERSVSFQGTFSELSVNFQ